MEAIMAVLQVLKRLTQLTQKNFSRDLADLSGFLQGHAAGGVVMRTGLALSDLLS